MRVVYSPLDAVQIAAEHPDQQVVFFGVGFETTAPANAMAVAAREAARARQLLACSSLTCSCRRRSRRSCRRPRSRVQAFLAAGHVCTVMGTWQYEPLAARFRVPIVVTGFEPLDLLEGIRRACAQLEAGRGEVENAYARVVRAEGNRRPRAARRGVRGVRPAVARHRRSSRERLALSAAYREFDAERGFDVGDHHDAGIAAVPSGEVLQGLLKPNQCPAFGTGVHAAHAARRDDGLRRGRVRRVLPVPAPRRPDAAPSRCRRLTDADGRPSRSTSGLVVPAAAARLHRIVLGHGGGGKLSASWSSTCSCRRSPTRRRAS